TRSVIDGRHHRVYINSALRPLAFARPARPAVVIEQLAHCARLLSGSERLTRSAADRLWCSAKPRPARLEPSSEQRTDLDRMTVSWLQRVVGADRREGWSEHARESILDANDGIVTAAGVAEGFAKAGASTGTLLLAGAAVILAGGLAAAGARYSEERTEW